MVQPKHDGAYCHVHLDRGGCIERISSRTGADYENGNVTGLIGQFVGYPGAVLVGELTAHTEAGNAEAIEFGARRVHLFDIAFGMDSRPLHDLPYGERRSELYRMHVAVESFGGGQSWTQTKCAPKSKRSGKFTRKTWRGTALTPIVPQFRPDACDDPWDMVKAGKLEGLVAVSQAAPMGRRGAKRKCKLTSTLDALVIRQGAKSVELLHLGQRFYVNKAKRALFAGDVVEVAHDGRYGDGTPKFARIVRVRHVLMLAP